MGLQRTGWSMSSKKKKQKEPRGAGEVGSGFKRKAKKKSKSAKWSEGSGGWVGGWVGESDEWGGCFALVTYKGLYPINITSSVVSFQLKAIPFMF